MKKDENYQSRQSATLNRIAQRISNSQIELHTRSDEADALAHTLTLTQMFIRTIESLSLETLSKKSTSETVKNHDEMNCTK